MQQLIPNQANAHVPVNENFATLGWASVYGNDPGASSGLHRGYFGIGSARGDGTFIEDARWGGFDVTAVDHTFGANLTTYVCVDLTDGTLDFSTTDTNYLDSVNFAKVETVVTGASSVTSVVDDRGGPGGVWGGAGGGPTLGTAAALDVDTDGTLAANSDALIATQKAVKTAIAAAISNLLGGAPGSLDTLDELAAALADDANFATTVVGLLSNKAPLASPALSGTPTVPTAAPGTNTTQAASTAFVAAAVTLGASPFTGGTLTSAINEAPTVTIASSTTPAIGAAAGNTISITGTTTITGFDTIAAGARRLLVFAGALTFTHNATSLILPGAANITTAAGDTAELVSIGAGNWRCVTYSKASGAAVAGGGGLVSLTEALNTASPNATNNAVSLTVSGGSAINDLALVPKGTGALIGAVPDATLTGGDKRGLRAVDWQLVRGATNQVASGTSSVIGGGTGNRVVASFAVIAGGSSNDITNTTTQYSSIGGGATNSISGTGTHATIGGGSANSMSSSGVGNTIGGGNTNSITGTASQSVISGGSQNTVSGIAAAIVGGERNSAAGNYSVAMGFRAGTRAVTGMVAHSAQHFSTTGDAQYERYVMSRQSTSATPVTLTATQGAASASNQPLLPTNSSMSFTGVVHGRNGTTSSAGWQISGTIKNVSGTVSLVGTPTVTSIGADAGAAAWAVAVAADNTNKCLQINVTGAAATTINWVAFVESAFVI